MAILKYRDAQKLSPKELTSKSLELKRELMRLRSQVASGTAPENPGKIRELKRSIARLASLSQKVEGGSQPKR